MQRNMQVIDVLGTPGHESLRRFRLERVESLRHTFERLDGKQERGTNVESTLMDNVIVSHSSSTLDANAFSAASSVSKPKNARCFPLECIYFLVAQHLLIF